MQKTYDNTLLRIPAIPELLYLIKTRK